MSSTPKSPKASAAAVLDSAASRTCLLTGEVLIAAYNDLPTVEALLSARDSLAAVIVEPL